MYFTERKLGNRLAELANYRYRDGISIVELRFREDLAGNVGEKPPVDDQGWTPVHIGDRWEGRDRYAWIAADVDVPASWIGRRILGLFDFGKTGGGNNSGFESMLYMDGIPYQGVDSNHQEVFFKENVSGKRVSLQFRLWSGLEGGGEPRKQEHRLSRAELAWLDDETDDLYFTGRAVLEAVSVLDRSHPQRAQLLSAIDQAFLLIDWSKPGSENFYDGVRHAGDDLRKKLNEMPKQAGITVTCVGHTHIDVAWLWRLKHTREKAARSFLTVMRLMEIFPEYMFLQTQPQLYDYVKRDYPELYAQMRERIAEGRFESDGAMWLEADCNVTSGESLVRQILFGTRFFRGEFGVECSYLWLPDVFGYSWALPQILCKSGIKTFMTTKISWNQYNRMPHDTFWWRGIDGSEVLAHFITTPEGTGNRGWQYTYNGRITAATVTGVWEQYQDKALNDELLLSFGYGDGGGGPNREMLEMRRRLNLIPGLPQVVAGRANDYFERLHQTVEATREPVQTWDGELYLEFHRGTYTSQAYNKRMNRKLELRYREVEWLNAAAACNGQQIQTELHANQTELNAGWKIILRNQFHDIIPGSSIHEVYEDSREEYREADEIAQKVWDQAAARIVRTVDGVFTVFNSAAFERSDIICVPKEGTNAEGHFVDDAGAALLAQESGHQWLVLSPIVPALGWAVIKSAPGSSTAERDSLFTRRPHGVTTPFYNLEWNENGQLVRLYDRTAHREVLSQGARANVFQRFEDKPLNFDAWDIDIFYQQKMREVDELLDIEWIADGPLCSMIQFRWVTGDSTIVQELKLYAHSRRIDFVTRVDWRERQTLLKVAFPVAIRATEATYDIQFGNVKRPTHWNTSWDQARFESVGHQWVDLSEHGYGVSLANDCKYGYDVKDNVLRLSLLKSSIRPDFDADQGAHEFTYALIPHQDGWFDGGVQEEAWNLNSPLKVMPGSPAPPSSSLFHVSSERVQVDAVKIAEDSHRIVLRLHDYAGGRGNVVVTSGFPMRSWQECDLMERPVGERHSDAFAFELAPFEIKTFLVDFDHSTR